MNSNKTNFKLLKPINITSYYLLGLIEGDGTFSISRNPIRPTFQILLTASQEPLLIKIKEFLIDNLELDNNSLWYIRNSTAISINLIKAKGNAKSTVLLEIRDINLLYNYFIPFLSKLNFISKKLLDFLDFKVICEAIYKGVHRINNIKDLILKLSYSMNDYRLTTYKGNDKQLITYEELALIKNTNAIFGRLSDGRVKDLTTNEIDPRISNNIYLITKSDNSELSCAVKTLKEAAETISINYNTLSKKLNLTDVDVSDNIIINRYNIKRIGIFKPLKV